MGFKLVFHGPAHPSITIDETFPTVQEAKMLGLDLADHLTKAGYDFMGIYVVDDQQMRVIRRFKLGITVVPA